MKISWLLLLSIHVNICYIYKAKVKNELTRSPKKTVL